mmetsp:Transcript_25945/g.72393  ORF Transcript_25945/g.72393 Transcript_25945/m.72393 type:complete len:318 (+) Transcript_25945:1384-2337(+)
MGPPRICCSRACTSGSAPPPPRPVGSGWPWRRSWPGRGSTPAWTPRQARPSCALMVLISLSAACPSSRPATPTSRSTPRRRLSRRQAPRRQCCAPCCRAPSLQSSRSVSGLHPGTSTTGLGSPTAEMRLQDHRRRAAVSASPTPRVVVTRLTTWTATTKTMTIPSAVWLLCRPCMHRLMPARICCSRGRLAFCAPPTRCSWGPRRTRAPGPRSCGQTAPRARTWTIPRGLRRRTLLPSHGREYLLLWGRCQALCAPTRRTCPRSQSPCAPACCIWMSTHRALRMQRGCGGHASPPSRRQMGAAGRQCASSSLSSRLT